jgi:hypothetical protein
MLFRANPTPNMENSVHIAPSFSEGSRREKLLFTCAAVVLVLLRGFVPAYYEGFDFGADQAIVGLMARHLSTLHDFPLYYYGLNYLLGVEAWIIAPFFLLFRSSVAAMRIPFVILNVIVAVWLMAEIGERLRLSRAVSFTAALPFIMPNPAVSSQLLGTAGACVEPFVYVLLLWRLRFRPIGFGMLLAFGSLHREFTILALPAILLVEAANGSLWDWHNIRRAGWMACGFGFVWLIVDDLKMHLSGGALTLQISSLGNQMCFDRDSPQRVAALLAQAAPALFGSLKPVGFGGFSLSSGPPVGSVLVGWLVGVATLVMALRLVQNRRQPPQSSADAGFGLYLACVGVLTACVYPLSCNIGLGNIPLLRYLLLGLLIPVGLFASFMAREPSRTLRNLMAAIFVMWAAANLFDNGKLVVSAVGNPPVSEHRLLTNYLLSHHIRYARAIYWDAYVVDFLSRERVIVESTDKVRIPEYQQQVEEHARDAVTLVRQPCTAAEMVASWCIQK